MHLIIVIVIVIIIIIRPYLPWSKMIYIFIYSGNRCCIIYMNTVPVL